MAKTISDLLNDFVSSRNRHEVNDIMRFYADSITSKLAGVWLKNGKEAMQGVTEWDIIMKPIYKISHTMLFGDSVRCRLIESNEWLRVMGIESIVYEPFLITVKDDRITAINTEFAIDSFKKYQNAWTTIIDWIHENHPEQHAKFFVNDTFNYSGATARQWLDLVKEYQKTTK